MSSGIYSALSGAMARMQMMDTISDNLANVNTPGFKKGMGVFESMVTDAMKKQGGRGDVVLNRVQDGLTDFTSGTIRRTGVPLHMAINGEGFFKVRDEAGRTLYTRQGNMRLGANGALETGSGMKVLDDGGNPITLPSEKVNVSANGTISFEGGGSVQVGIFEIPDKKALERVSGGVFTLKAGAQEQPAPKAQIVSESLEDSNVNTMQEMVEMIQANRLYESYQKMMLTFGSLDSKANELGTVG